jgi:hypothetical protein
MATKKPAVKNQGMTLSQLAARTTMDRIERSRYVKLLKTKMGHDANGYGFIAAQTTTTKVVDQSGRLVRHVGSKYITMVTFFDKQLHCRVSCSCDDNLFRWEVANTKRNAAEIEYSNGERPKVTNPTMNPGLCKHLYALYVSVRFKLPK